MEKTTKSFGLGLIGFSEQQKETFEAIMSLAESRLKNAWQIVDLVRADFYLVSAEKLQSEALIAENKLPIERCLFCSGQDVRASNEISTDVRNIPRLGSLVEMLNQMASTEILISTAATASSSPPGEEQVVMSNNDKVSPDSDSIFFDPEQCFLKYFLRKDSKDFFLCRFISPEGKHTLYVNMPGKVYFCQTGLKNLGSSLGVENAISIQIISQSEWSEQFQQAALPARPLSNLIWYIAFKLSNGRLLKGHLSEESIYLTRWPDLAVQDCGRYVKLAAFMRNNALCLTEVAEKTTIPLAEVYDFYNACFLIGIVGKTAQSEVREKILDDDKQQLLAKIANRLKRLNSHQEAG